MAQAKQAFRDLPFVIALLSVCSDISQKILHHYVSHNDSLNAIP